MGTPNFQLLIDSQHNFPQINIMDLASLDKHSHVFPVMTIMTAMEDYLWMVLNDTPSYLLNFNAVQAINADANMNVWSCFVHLPKHWDDTKSHHFCVYTGNVAWLVSEFCDDLSWSFFQKAHQEAWEPRRRVWNYKFREANLSVMNPAEWRNILRFQWNVLKDTRNRYTQKIRKLIDYVEHRNRYQTEAFSLGLE